MTRGQHIQRTIDDAIGKLNQAAELLKEGGDLFQAQAHLVAGSELLEHASGEIWSVSQAALKQLHLGGGDSG